MKLDLECYQPLFPFDLEQLTAELAQFSDGDWLRHAPEPLGEASIPLVAVGGTRNLDYAIAGPMQPTAWLKRCPGLLALLQALDMPLSRCRLVRLGGNTALPAQVNHTYHMFRRRTILIPLVTQPAVSFTCNDQTRHLPAGTAWTFDHTQPHCLVNQGEETSILLVVESKGARGEGREGRSNPATLQLCNSATLRLEPYCFEVLEPEEMAELTAAILAEAETSSLAQATVVELHQAVELFQQGWAAAFARFGHHPAGELAYQDLLLRFQEQLLPKLNQWLRSPAGRGMYASEVLRSMLFTAPAAPARLNQRLLQVRRKRKTVATRAEVQSADFDRPLFIVSAPRAGSTLLFETLSQFPALWTIGEESHEVIEGLPELHPAAHGYHSNRLTAAAASPPVIALLQERFTRQLQDRSGQLYVDLPAAQRPPDLRFLEKTPKNALRIPFLKAVFPSARFLYLYREPRENISSLIEGWRSRRFIGYRPLPGWPYQEWSFLLVPGWERLSNSSVAEIAAYQWQIANQTIVDDLLTLPMSDWQLIRYTDLVRRPKQTVEQIAQFAGLTWDQQAERAISRALPISSMTVSAPEPDKWRKNEWQLAHVLPEFEPMVHKLETVTTPHG